MFLAAGCTSSSTTAAGGGVPATSTASASAVPAACPSEASGFTKTKFVAHAALGSGAFHRYIYKEPFSSGYATSRICNTWMALASWPARQGQQRSLRRMCQEERHDLLDIHGIIFFTAPAPSRCARSRSTRSASASRAERRPARRDHRERVRSRHVGPPGRQREQLSVLVVQVDPVLAPVLAVGDELEVLAASGWNGWVTRTRRYRSCGSGVVDDVG
jgi:hypothetical protein